MNKGYYETKESVKEYIKLAKDVNGKQLIEKLEQVLPADSVRRQQEILNPGGIVCHSFWKGEGSEIFKGLFVNYHSKTDLSEIRKDYFEILSIESYREFEDGDSLLLIARKK